MPNPYRIEGPAVLSFSGGATSAYMLKHILDAHGGQLPPDVLVCFQNTGCEHEKTLAFVERCATEWSVPVVWLEYVPHDPRVRPALAELAAAGIIDVAERRRLWSRSGWRQVDFASASRNGEPFEAMVLARGYVPNPATRICTTELKIRVVKRWLMARGWERWDSVLGIRADEPRRVSKLQRATGDRWENVMPLAEAGVTVQDVTQWWDRQPFQLGLKRGEGNCGGCFLKATATVAGFCEAEPGRAEWWAAIEERTHSTFRIDRPTYRQMINYGRTQVSLPLVDDADLGVDCFCGEG